jgi:hypothetical protein
MKKEQKESYVIVSELTKDDEDCFTETQSKIVIAVFFVILVGLMAFLVITAEKHESRYSDYPDDSVATTLED